MCLKNKTPYQKVCLTCEINTRDWIFKQSTNKSTSNKTCERKQKVFLNLFKKQQVFDLEFWDFEVWWLLWCFSEEKQREQKASSLNKYFYKNPEKVGARDKHIKNTKLDWSAVNKKQ